MKWDNLTEDESIIFAALDGLEYWEEIRNMTGCTESECKDMLARKNEIKGKWIENKKRG